MPPCCSTQSSQDMVPEEPTPPAQDSAHRCKVVTTAQLFQEPNALSPTPVSPAPITPEDHRRQFVALQLVPPPNPKATPRLDIPVLRNNSNPSRCSS